MLCLIRDCLSTTPILWSLRHLRQPRLVSNTRTISEVFVALAARKLAFGDVPLLQYGFNDIILPTRAEFALQLRLRCAVEDALCALPVVEAILSASRPSQIPNSSSKTMGVRPAYLCVTKTSKLFATCTNGMLLSFFHSCTAFGDSTKTMKSSPVWGPL